MPIESGLGDDMKSRMSSQVERETSALVIVNKAALAIVMDSIEISFMKFGGNLWKYESSSSQPTLSHPLETTRRATPRENEDTGWKEFFDKLIQDLPAEISARLIREREKLREERNLPYVALDEFLVSTAKALAWLERASEVDNPNSVSYKNALLNLELPKILADNLEKAGDDILVQAREYLNNVGSNYAHFDRINDNINQIQNELNRMKLLSAKDK
jgi:hypothetical protein